MPNGSFKPLAKTAICSGLPLLLIPRKHSDVARLGLGHEKIAIGSGANDPRIVEPGRVLLHFEAFRNLRPCAFRTRHNLRAIARRRASRKGAGRSLTVILRISPGFS